MAQPQTTPSGASASGRREKAYESRPQPNTDGNQMVMFRHFGEAMFDGFTRMNREFLQFVSTRFTEDVRAARSFANCRHPSELVEAELRFMQNLVSHYAENANRMLGIAANVAGHNLDEAEEVFTEAVGAASAPGPQRSAA